MRVPLACRQCEPGARRPPPTKTASLPKLRPLTAHRYSHSHGWPVAFAIRSSIYTVSAGRGISVQTITGDVGRYSRWPIDDSSIIAFSAVAAVSDVLFCLALVCGTFVGARKLTRRFGLRLRFGIRSLLVGFSIFAVVLASRHWLFASRYVLEAVAISARSVHLSPAFAFMLCMFHSPKNPGA